MSCEHLEIKDVRRADGSPDYRICKNCHEKWFPNPCVRCGCCCLMQVCPVGQQIFKVGKNQRCPGLHFDGDVAQCDLVRLWEEWKIPADDAKKVMGIGSGCCISARLFAGGERFYFAELPPDKKIHYVRQMRKEYGI